MQNDRDNLIGTDMEDERRRQRETQTMERNRVERGEIGETDDDIEDESTRSDLGAGE